MTYRDKVQVLAALASTRNLSTLTEADQDDVYNAQHQREVNIDAVNEHRLSVLIDGLRSLPVKADTGDARAEGTPTFLSGQRIAHVCTRDPYTRLVPGSQGTVLKQQDATVHVRWDDGSTLSPLLNAGDEARTIGPVESVAPPMVRVAEAPPLSDAKARSVLSGFSPPIDARPLPHDADEES